MLLPRDLKLLASGGKAGFFGPFFAFSGFSPLLAHVVPLSLPKHRHIVNGGDAVRLRFVLGVFHHGLQVEPVDLNRGFFVTSALVFPEPPNSGLKLLELIGGP